MQLLPLPESGDDHDQIPRTEFLDRVAEMTRAHYQSVGYEPPWIGYLALENGDLVGTCGFKSPPSEGRVEIAYGTVPGKEGQGIATRMAQMLANIAKEHDPPPIVVAQTLPEENASTSILKKLGFRWKGTVEHPEDGTVWEWELSDK